MKQVITIPNFTHQAEPTKTVQDNIQNNGFFPNLSLNAIREQMRVDGTVTDQRLLMATCEAMATVNHALKTFRLANQKNGIASLNDTESEQLNGESVNLLRYRRAVMCYALANLYERYTAFDLTQQGADKAEKYNDSVDDLKRDAQIAIRDILNQERISVSLI